MKKNQNAEAAMDVSPMAHFPLQHMLFERCSTTNPQLIHDEMVICFV